MIEVINEELLQKVKDNGMKCLCTIDETPCMCEEFKDAPIGTTCHCNVYRKYNGGE